jgi:4-hydroxybenzoate polyprenyltransferase
VNRKPTFSLTGLIRATHFGPTVLVVTISFILARTQYSTPNALEVALAVLAGQCVVGWSNELVDFPRDQAAGRLKKPLVAGAVSQKSLQWGICLALFAAGLLSYFGPLGIKGTLLHALGILSATLYNLKLKQTILSPLPYMISFGGMPFTLYYSNGKFPSVWLVLVFVLFATAFHFLNVLKDLDWDLRQGVLGMPQRLGRLTSLVLAGVLILSGATLAISRWNSLL